MTLSLDKSSATIDIDLKGMKTAVHVGRQSFLMHCSRNVNLGCVDAPAGTRKTTGDAAILKGRVLVAGDPASNADRTEISSWNFAFIQVAKVMVYEFGYAGRMDNEGSVAINVRPGFNPNPCFDGDSISLDDAFDSSINTVTQVTTPKPGFQVESRHGDNPSTLLDLRFTNTSAGAPNFIHRARRDEDFVAYLIARDPQGTVHFLSRVGWHLIWDAQFQWSSPAAKPTPVMLTSVVEKGSVLLGPPPASDAHAQMAFGPRGDTANAMDGAAFDAALGRRDARFVTQSLTRPGGLPTPFFPQAK